MTTDLFRTIQHIRVLFHLFPQKLIVWLRQAVHTYIWRQLQKIGTLLLGIKSTSESDRGYDCSDPQDLLSAPHKRGPVQAAGSPCCGLHEPASFTTPSVLTRNSGVSSVDSLVEVEIEVVPPDNPPSGSGDIIHLPNSQPGPNTPFETEIPRDASGLLPGNANENPSPGLSPRTRHLSIQSSDSSDSSRPATSTHHASLQTIQRQASDSYSSIIVYPEMENGILGGPSLHVNSDVYPLLPSDLERYRRKRPIARREYLRPVQVLPNTRNFSDGPGVLPEGWVQIIHPEGQPTFYNKSKKIITESWIFNNEIYQCLDDSFITLKTFIQELGFDLTPDCHLVLEVEEIIQIANNGQRRRCGYYYVSLTAPNIFWLEQHDITKLFIAPTEVSDVQIKIQLECQYWYHWSFFPDVHDVTQPILDMMSNLVSDIRTDLLTSPEQTSFHFKMEDLKNWEVSIEGARKQLLRENSERPTSWFVGRFMFLVRQIQFHNFYGKYGARLSRTQTVYDLPKRSPTWLIKAMSPLFFSAPDVHLKIMEGLWVDRLTLKGPWSSFFTQLLAEWKWYTTYAAILLNANVAFLAIPSNDHGGSSNTSHRSPAQVASYISVVTSSSSILLGLLLVRQYQTRDRSSIMDQNNFLMCNDHPTRGFEALAIIYSLPYALLIWGLVTFFIAFLSMCFQSSDIATCSVVGIISLFVAYLIVWCIQKGWADGLNSWWTVAFIWSSKKWWWWDSILRRGDEKKRLEVPEAPQHGGRFSGWTWLCLLRRKALPVSDAERTTGEGALPVPPRQPE
ncbi:hypothetical protein BDZ94DRAFT_1253759 [Collybia nuda]|uniref:WW domain-containing protein n=1 Tax=Collybia nuda TaxID=64659 RepID=A0A9P5YD06_9AGAR|nr:hypothetical protein BDZ94DRAFT_1253759 [Collybia nuda]